MHKRSIITILLTILVFSAAVVLGVSSVYRVNAVTLEVSVISEVAEEEADSLQKKLLSRYQSESIFFVSKRAAEEEFAAFPYFRMVSFRKEYPNRLVISASEDAEVFAAAREDGSYYILGGDGTILGIREDSSNRSDGGANVVVTGLSASGEKGEVLGGDGCIPALLSFCRAADSVLNGLRSNVVSVEVVRPTSSSEDMYFCLSMREGVKIYVHNPENLTAAKAERALGFYLGTLPDRPEESGDRQEWMTDAKRLGGRIIVTDDAYDGENVLVSYDPQTSSAAG